MTAHNGSAPPAAPAPVPITDVSAWLGSRHSLRETFRGLGELLSGVAVTAEDAMERAEAFTARNLGVATLANAVVEERSLNSVEGLTTALALAEWMHELPCETGPFRFAELPTWTETTVGDATHRHPGYLRVAFPAGTLHGSAPIVIAINVDGRDLSLTGVGRPQHRDAVRDVLARLAKRADELNPFRHKAVRAAYSAGRMSLEIVELPPGLSRETVILPAGVWHEIDLGITAVRDLHQTLVDADLGCRRAVLLCGPPGVGKSAVSACVATELVGTFTVVFVDAQVGSHLLTDVVEEIQRSLSPAVIVLEDIDLLVRDRTQAGSSVVLAQLLTAMETSPTARILTLASTNDVSVLDRALVRAGRYDSIVDVPYPSRTAAAAILDSLLLRLPGEHAVDTAAVAAALPDATSGAAIKELVKRAVLGANVTTEGLIAEIGSGRYLAELPTGGGNYL